MKTLVNTLMMRVIEYFASKDMSQITHTLCVHEYTRLIALREGYKTHKVLLLELAALLHDIGCPRSKELYGNCLPVNQERIGAEIVSEWMPAYGKLAPKEIDWLVKVVGTHHQLPMAKEYGFEALFEADLIVNLMEGYYPKEKAALYEKNMVRTASGKALFELFFHHGKMDIKSD